MGANYRSLKWYNRREKIDGLLFVAPFIILILLFSVGPIIASIVLSFKEYSMLDQVNLFKAKSVGLQNYIEAFSDKTMIRALVNTTIYSVGVVPVQLVIALGLAVILNGNVKGKAFFRSAYYIPTITSTVAVSVMFMFLFKTDGLVNNILGIFGVPAYSYFNNPSLALPFIMMMAIWSSIGLYMIIFIAGLQKIPTALYESSSLDGADAWQQFRFVTLPLLKPIVFLNLVVSMIGTFQTFDQSFVVSGGNGGPLDATMTMVLYIYRTGFRDFQMGYACAVAFILFIIIFVLTLIQRKFFGEETVM